MMSGTRCNGSIPATIEAITAPWLASRIAPDHSLNGFSTERIGTGQMAMNVRITLDWAAPDPDSSAGALPQTVVLKLPSDDPISKATGVEHGAYTKEVRFYRELAPATKARTARCYAIEDDPASGDFVLVMEDLAPGQVGDQLAGCSVAQAELAVEVAVKLHASWWDHPKLGEIAEWGGGPPDSERIAMLEMLWSLAWPQFLERQEDNFTADQRATTEEFGRRLGSWVSPQPGALTVVHGDFRVDNMLFGPDWMVPVDWQTFAVGTGINDIGYFLGASLLPDVRAVHEQRLVRQWYDGMRAAVPANAQFPDWPTAWAQYRRASFTGLFMAVVASFLTVRTERGDEMFWAMASRHLAQVAHLDALSLV